MNAADVYRLGTSELVKEAQGGLLSAAGRALGFTGKKILPKTWKALRYGFGGRRAIREPLLWGSLLGGPLGYLAAPEGQKLQGTLSGALGMIASVAGWRGAQRLARAGVVKGLGTPSRVGQFARRAKRPWFTQKRLFGGPPKTGVPLIQDIAKNPREVAKALGSKALLTGLPFLGAWEISGIPHEAGWFNITPGRVGGLAYTGYQRLPRGYGITPALGYPYRQSPYEQSQRFY